MIISETDHYKQSTSINRLALIISVVDTSKKEKYDDLEFSLQELGSMAEHLGYKIFDFVNQKRMFYSNTYVGSGKLEEINEIIVENDIKAVIANDNLDPEQQRNLERKLKVTILDRTSVILQIFEKRATTNEGKLQTQLARSEYLLPRLTRQWTHLERLGGGIGTRGPGEAQIQTDRRLISKRIKVLKSKIDKIQKNRELQRKNRHKNNMPIATLIGYTNAGKSSLFNLVTTANVAQQDMPFTTLDTTIRKLKWCSNVKQKHKDVLLADTVGFISRLNPGLIDAFMTTLQEVVYADVLVHVIDISDANYDLHNQSVWSVLKQMKIKGKEVILVANKIDLIANEKEKAIKIGIERIASIKDVEIYTETVAVSVRENWNIDMLSEKIYLLLLKRKFVCI